MVSTRISWVPPSGSTFEIRGPSSLSSALPHLLGHELRYLRQDTNALHGSVRTLVRGMETRKTVIITSCNRVDRVRRRVDAFDVDIAFLKQVTAIVEDDVLALQARAKTTEARQLQAEQDRARDREEIQRLRTRLDAAESEMIRRGSVEAHLIENINVLAVYGDARPLGSQGPPDGP
ncbi:hypothetical protein Tco_0628127 [Tanacetum coccineum]|uniref:Uncharacterized protein n=1 Tax=Tanacetum coccineum TaxID=301880 RepID=A0ABQ4WPD9_9ASTR